MEQFTGKVWILGDDIDTDIIIPTEYLALPTVEDMKQYGFSPLSSFCNILKKGPTNVLCGIFHRTRHLDKRLFVSLYRNGNN